MPPMKKCIPGLFRPIILRKSRYNQHLTSGASIIEVGATRKRNGTMPKQYEILIKNTIAVTIITLILLPLLISVSSTIKPLIYYYPL